MEKVVKAEMYAKMLKQGNSYKSIADFFKIKEESVKKAIRKYLKEEEQKMNTKAYEEFNDFEEEQQELETYKVMNCDCIDCGTSFKIYPSQQKTFKQKNYELPKRCEACRKARKEEKTFVCIDCNNEFKMKATKIKYFENSGMQIPKRCDSCIEYKKERNKAKENQQVES